MLWAQFTERQYKHRFMKKYIVRNILVPVSHEYNLTEHICANTRIPKASISDIEILRRSIDARKKSNIMFNFTLLVTTDSDLSKYKFATEYDEEISVFIPTVHTYECPVIVGAGPAGLFTALAMVENGLKPVIIDRGETIERRVEKIARFWKNGKLDENSNVQFGEGGAGTFSDGKLTARNRDTVSDEVFRLLIEFGADSSISYEALPHIGSDVIRKVIINIRNHLIRKGCEFKWSSQLQEINTSNGKIESIVINNELFTPEHVVLGIGNAARDTFLMLEDNNVVIHNKPFAVGFRMEHPQDFINDSFYGKDAPLDILGPATYKLTHKYKTESTQKGVYSFCMCPGGFIVASASEKETVVLNGMSYSLRDNRFANSALVVTVNESDYGTKLFAGMEFQREVEKKCYSSSNPYYAPVQTMNSFLNIAKKSKIRSSYKPGVYKRDLQNIYSPVLTKAIKSSLRSFERRVKGFINEGILHAPETRTSSPVRIVRDPATRASISCSNLYPVGEGAGYAGGIISSAVDGYTTGKMFAQ